MKPRLRIYQAVDNFGPGLQSDAYWYAEVYDATDPFGRQLWAAGFGDWLEAFRGGSLALAEKAGLVP